MTTAEKRKACGYHMRRMDYSKTWCSICKHSVGFTVVRCNLHKMMVRWFAVCNDFEKKGGE